MSFAHLNTNCVIIFQGGHLTPKYDSNTNYYYFDQEIIFYYLAGIRDQNMFFVLDAQNGEGTLFYEQEPEQYKLWMTVPSLEDIEKKYGLKTYYKKIQKHFYKKKYGSNIYIRWSK